MSPSPVDVAPPGYASGRTHARVAIGALALRTCLHLPVLAFIPLASIIVAAVGRERALEITRAMTVATFAALVVAGTAFLVWMHRAVANARALAGEDMPYTPGDAIAGWFIPFVNLVRPYQVMRAIERTALGPLATPSSLVSSWWAMYWGRLVVQTIVAMTTRSTDHGGRVVGAIASLAVELVSVGFAIALVRYLERIQTERAAMTPSAIAEVFR